MDLRPRPTGARTCAAPVPVGGDTQREHLSAPRCVGRNHPRGVVGYRHVLLPRERPRRSRTLSRHLCSGPHAAAPTSSRVGGRRVGDTHGERAGSVDHGDSWIPDLGSNGFTDRSSGSTGALPRVQGRRALLSRGLECGSDSRRRSRSHRRRSSGGSGNPSARETRILW